MTTAPLSVKVRLRKVGVLDTLLYGCVTWTLSEKHLSTFQSAQHQVLLQVMSFQSRQHTGHTTPSLAKAIKTTRCESIEMTIRKRRVFLRRRGAAKRGPITQSGDVRDGDWWVGPKTGGKIEDLE